MCDSWRKKYSGKFLKLKPDARPAFAQPTELKGNTDGRNVTLNHQNIYTRWQFDIFLDCKSWSEGVLCDTHYFAYHRLLYAGHLHIYTWNKSSRYESIQSFKLACTISFCSDAFRSSKRPSSGNIQWWALPSIWLDYVSKMNRGVEKRAATVKANKVIRRWKGKI